tara:strand:- start:38 stop:484 length:447 start_codon:yes stop_codon:yes gene_type:complete
MKERFNMKTLLMTGLSVAVLSMPAMAQEESSADLAKKIDLAKQYSQVVPVQDEVNTAIENLVLQVPKDDRVLFKSILERTIKVPQLQKTSEMALADIFSERELQALVTFYSSPEGMAVREKMPEYQQRLKPVLEQMIRESLEAYNNQK